MGPKDGQDVRSPHHLSSPSFQLASSDVRNGVVSALNMPWPLYPIFSTIRLVGYCYPVISLYLNKICIVSGPVNLQQLDASFIACRP